MARIIARVKPKTYHDGNVQSLMGLDAEGNPVKSLGVVMPGDYDFGTAERRETIHVIEGCLTINGRKYRLGEAECVIEAGQQIQIKAEKFSTYTCTYGKQGET